MCLTILKYFRVNKDYGYKWLSIEDGKLRSPRFNKDIIYKKRKWYTAETRPILDNNQRSYAAGFHIYYSLSVAKKSWLRSSIKPDNRLYKVKFKDYITGFGDGSFKKDIRQIVAQKMLIIKEV